VETVKKCCRKRNKKAQDIDGGQAALSHALGKSVGNAITHIGILPTQTRATRPTKRRTASQGKKYAENIFMQIRGNFTAVQAIGGMMANRLPQSFIII
jgi:hypothetical protein